MGTAICIHRIELGQQKQNIPSEPKQCVLFLSIFFSFFFLLTFFFLDFFFQIEAEETHPGG